MMTQQNNEIDWETIQESELRMWYYVSKIMKSILPGNFPYYTFKELWLQITQDPEYKPKDN